MFCLHYYANKHDPERSVIRFFWIRLAIQERRSPILWVLSHVFGRYYVAAQCIRQVFMSLQIKAYCYTDWHLTNLSLLYNVSRLQPNVRACQSSQKNYPHKAICLQCKVIWRASGSQTEAGWKAEWQPCMMAPLDKQEPTNESLSECHHPLSQCNYRTEW